MPIEWRLFCVFVIYVIGMWVILEWIDKNDKKK
jgi:hypothetical protein